MSAFIKILARRTEDRRVCRVEVNHGLDLEVRLDFGEFGDDWSMFVK